MNAVLELLKPGVFTTVQDGGRPGLAYFAVPRSGPMDVALARRANRLVGNRPDAAVLEFNLMGGALRFATAARIALTGADLRWTLRGRAAPRERLLEADAGDVLEGTYSADGARAYLAVAGELVRARELGSVAMHAQIHGRLEKGARLEFAPASARPTRPADRGRLPVALGDAAEFGLDLLPGPEWTVLTADAREHLRTSRWSVSPQSDRVGTRLRGPVLALRPGASFATVPVWVDCVQVDPSGSVIVVGVDGGVLGGYLRVATLVGVHV